jgi:hypothetical protein
VSKLNAAKLRHIARTMEDISMNRTEIKFSNKKYLLKVIVGSMERRGE